MSLVKQLNSKHISELELVFNEINTFSPSRDISHENLNYLYNPLVTSSVLAATLGEKSLIGGIISAGLRVKNLNSKKSKIIKKNIIEIEKEHREKNEIDSFVDNSVAKIKNTDAYHILSETVVENIEKGIGEYIWDALEDNSKVFITTAEVLREFLEVFNNSMDYSSPTLNYCKSVENELNQKLLVPFKTYFSTSNMTLKNSDFTSRLSYVVVNEKINLTLGEHVYILRKIINNKKLTRIENEYKNFLEIINSVSLEQLNDRINIVTKYYRNPSSHAELVNRKKCLECREHILTEEGILVGILNNFNVAKTSFS